MNSRHSQGSRIARQSHRRSRLTLESLEDRRQPAVFVVTTTADEGPGSLRQAILDSDSTAGPNTIDFDILGGGVQTIYVGSTIGLPLPPITTPVLIDGYSQPGSEPNSLAQGDNAVLLIQIDGSHLTVGDGLDLDIGAITVQGLAVNHFPNTGLLIGETGVTGDVIQGNYVGIDPTGTFAEGNGWSGISISPTNSENTIGGTTPAARNISSGNGNSGIWLESAGPGNVVQGNYTGTNASGTAAVPNTWAGVTVHSSSGNLIGGTASGAGNLVSGNHERGIEIWDTGATNNVVEGNRVGTDVSGTVAIGNGWEGIAAFGGAENNIIGGTTAGAGNLSSGNTLGGVAIWSDNPTDTFGNVVEGNSIGTDITGNVAVPNQGDGVSISEASGNTIGGTTSGAGNIISGNIDDGVGIWSTNTNANLVEGNCIGTNATGTAVLGNQGNGVNIAWSATNTTIGGTVPGAGNVISGNALNGIYIWAPGTSGNIVEGNLIGTDVTGSAALGNTEDGVRIDWASSGNIVGGTTPGAGNVISANGSKGVELTGSDETSNEVEGNLIGTNEEGTSALGNQAGGISVNGGATDDTIGGTTASARNVISGNADHGVEIFDTGTSGNVIEGNFLGTDITGTAPLGNGLDGVGIFLGATDNTVGGTVAGAGNVISANGADGVEIYGSGTSGNLVAGNSIGTDVTGTIALGNTLDGIGIHDGASDNKVGGYGGALTRNLISGNQQDGVNVAESGTTDNVIEGNYIGTNIGGDAALGNGGSGVSISQGANDNVVGSVVAAAANVIAGNKLDGVSIFGDGTSTNAVAGNYIGTDAIGAQAVANGGDGVFLGASASGNVIGGTSSSDRNVISGNSDDGIVIRDAGTVNNAVSDNYIGINAAGTLALSNGGNGVEILDGASNNVIGGTGVGGNVISGNKLDGVSIHDPGTSFNAVSANDLGTDAQGRVAVRNKQDGVNISNLASSNLIGGQDAGEGNLISGNTGFGIAISGAATGTLVEGNLIGTNAAGTAALGNHLFGVDISGSATGNLIGGTTALTRNLISGNAGDGLDITGNSTTGNVVEGNYIGTDVSGSRRLANALDGVKIADGANGNTIGGIAPGAGNLISGNNLDGVSLNSSGIAGNVVQGNLIGTNATGTLDLSNGGDGVNIQFGGGNQIGGTVAVAGNIIAHNARNGVEVSGQSPGNSIRENSIYANAGLGIALNNGGNNNAVAPTLRSARNSSAGTTIRGRLVAQPNTTYTIELFSNPASGSNRNVQGKVYLVSFTVTTNSAGRVRFAFTLAFTIPAGEFITATATDPSGDTSQFSAGQIVR